MSLREGSCDLKGESLRQFSKVVKAARQKSVPCQWSQVNYRYIKCLSYGALLCRGYMCGPWLEAKGVLTSAI